jgi:hypothetical protein
MNSLVGVDTDGSDIMSLGDTRSELDADTYGRFVEEVRRDEGRMLLRAVRIGRQIPLDEDASRVQVVDYDLPVIILISAATTKNLRDQMSAETPGLKVDMTTLDQSAICHRNRLPSVNDNLVCLFPCIVLPHDPPRYPSESPLLRHEMVHLRKTLTSAYGENRIRVTYWNADLQPFCRQHFEEVLASAARDYLLEEWEACAENFDDAGRQRAFTHIYIPHALAGIARRLDWQLNDEDRYVNVRRMCDLISETL